MVDDKTKDTLQLIVDKANKLRSFGFEKHVDETGFGFSIEHEKDDLYTMVFDLVEEKERDAFLLTFRFFIQKNEPSSFQNLDNLSHSPGLSKQWIVESQRIKKDYLDYLEGYSKQTVELFDGHPSRLDMLLAGLYGGLVHANTPKLVKQFNKWTRDEVRASIFEQQFTLILISILGLIYKLGDISENELNNAP